jgi:hypothetical protein
MTGIGAPKGWAGTSAQLSAEASRKLQTPCRHARDGPPYATRTIGVSLALRLMPARHAVSLTDHSSRPKGKSYLILDGQPVQKASESTFCDWQCLCTWHTEPIEPLCSFVECDVPASGARPLGGAPHTASSLPGRYPSCSPGFLSKTLVLRRLTTAPAFPPCPTRSKHRHRPSPALN